MNRRHAVALALLASAVLCVVVATGRLGFDADPPSIAPVRPLSESVASGMEWSVPHEETDRRAVLEQDGMVARSTAEAFPGLADCIVRALSDEARAQCVAVCIETAGVPSPEEFAKLVCSLPDQRTECSRVFGRVLAAMSAGDAWDYIGRYQLVCPKYRESNFLIDAGRFADGLRPGWSEYFVASMRVELVFDPALGEAPVQMLEWFAAEGDETARWVLAEGGRGGFGGSAEQVTRAAVISTVLRKEPLAKIHYVQSVLASSSVPAGTRLGSLFVEHLLGPQAFVDGDPSQALSTLVRVLDDSRFQLSAAERLRSIETSMVPSSGRALLEELNRRARALQGH